MYKTIDPKDISTRELHGYLLGAVAPRPIAFASTIDSRGNVNLSPFSFFNVFGSNPPTLIFSPARRVRDNTTKHTLENVQEVGEVVINVVNYAMVEQISLASTEYPKGVNEFIKAGFTQVPSLKVKPPRVGESPVAFECKVKQIIATGEEGGAGNLIICEVVMVHIKEDILDEGGKIDQHKIDLVGRLGGLWYVRASGDALFEVPNPSGTQNIGFDGLPAFLLETNRLTANELAKLARHEALPPAEQVKAFAQSEEYRKQLAGKPDEETIYDLAKQHLRNNEVEKAWLYLLQLNNQ
ncbi:MAG: flavin reductase [Thermonema sp.]|uniref:flavin reductase family protein n=1 Tax=Thermonema sp. TaxID=2231181 RepID=UPI0021DB9E09|nr:flavin reductase family protein [Thermonema sp.]GIV39646.1 MAG: flavin reductase [Thermonema sp.]